MDSILKRILAMPFNLAIKIRHVKSLGQLHTGQIFETGDDVTRRDVRVGPAAMILKLQGVTVRRHSLHHAPRGLLAPFQR